MPEQIFESVSVILPVMDETISLKKTVDTIMSDCGNDVLEFIIVVSRKTVSESLAVCEQLKKKYGERIKVFQQTLPYLGGAMRDSFERAAGSHVLRAQDG
jgi:glycosyltransferase involved in cell wall biosynthesis